MKIKDFEPLHEFYVLLLSWNICSIVKDQYTWHIIQMSIRVRIIPSTVQLLAASWIHEENISHICLFEGT